MSTTRAEVKDKGYVKTGAVMSEKKIAIHRSGNWSWGLGESERRGIMVDQPPSAGSMDGPLIENKSLKGNTLTPSS